MCTKQSTSRSEQGFTLVELAIVLIIVGLLIGGILKGQELIANARVTSTASQIKGLEAATLTFLDTYQGMPGDLANPTTRMPNCAAGTACGDAAGNGNGRIGQTPAAALAADSEALGYFAQLSVADLIDGVDNSENLGIGQALLGASIGSSKYYRVGYVQTNTDLPGVGTPAAKTGHYISLTALAAGTAIDDTNSEGSGSLSPSQAERIDAKYDDGLPNTGNSLVSNTTGAGAAAGCKSGAGAQATYNTQNSEGDCSLYARIVQ